MHGRLFFSSVFVTIVEFSSMTSEKWLVILNFLLVTLQEPNNMPVYVIPLEI